MSEAQMLQVGGHQRVTGFRQEVVVRDQHPKEEPADPPATDLRAHEQPLGPAPRIITSQSGIGSVSDSKFDSPTSIRSNKPKNLLHHLLFRDRIELEMPPFVAFGLGFTLTSLGETKLNGPVGELARNVNGAAPVVTSKLTARTSVVPCGTDPKSISGDATNIYGASASTSRN